MGSAADLIIAAPSEALAIVASDYALGTYRGVNVDGLDPLKLAALHSLLTNKGIDGLLGAYQPVAEATANGPWLIRLPGELLAFLANTRPENQALVAAKWASTDQLQAEGWSQQDAEQFIARVVHFARTLRLKGRKSFYWSIADPGLPPNMSLELTPSVGALEWSVTPVGNPI